MAGLSLLHAADNDNTIVLDEIGVKNLRIETVEAAENDFEETVFALGRIAEIPERHGVLSSRISGRVLSLDAHEGDTVKAGQILVKVESRQPGNPPPVIELKSPIGGLVVRVPRPPRRAGGAGQGTAGYLRPQRGLCHRPCAGTSRRTDSPSAPKPTLSSPLSETRSSKAKCFALEPPRTARAAPSTRSSASPIPACGCVPDMRAEFSVVLSKRSNVMSVPRAALQGDASNRFVYVKHFDIPNAFIKTPVQVGQMNDRFVEITKGLFPADEVVTHGGYSLSFAGGGNVSLIEALDSAHGHKHAADGKEPTPEEEAAEKAAKAAGNAGGAETRPLRGKPRLEIRQRHSVPAAARIPVH